MSKLSIIIPVYNEKKTLLPLLDKVNSVFFGDIEKEVIVVDDYSVDGSREILKTLPQGKYIIKYHDKNYGKGMALRTGLKEATGDWVVIQDADLEYDPQDLLKMLKKIKEEQIKVVYGSRRLNRHYLNERHSGHVFALGGIFLTWLTNFLYQTNITDEPTCYKMFQTDLLKNLDLQCVKFEFCPEVTAKIAKKGIEIHEVPINYFPRKITEGKKIKFKDAVEAVWVLLKNRF